LVAPLRRSELPFVTATFVLEAIAPADPRLRDPPATTVVPEKELEEERMFVPAPENVRVEDPDITPPFVKANPPLSMVPLPIRATAFEMLTLAADCRVVLLLAKVTNPELSASLLLMARVPAFRAVPPE